MDPLQKRYVKSWGSSRKLGDPDPRNPQWLRPCWLIILYRKIQRCRSAVDLFLTLRTDRGGLKVGHPDTSVCPKRVCPLKRFFKLNLARGSNSQARILMPNLTTVNFKMWAYVPKIAKIGNFGYKFTQKGYTP